MLNEVEYQAGADAARALLGGVSGLARTATVAKARQPLERVQSALRADTSGVDHEAGAAAAREVLAAAGRRRGDA